ncbi:MAG: hypothetical protein V3T83_06435 [Acidobacteriota bacterium]
MPRKKKQSKQRVAKKAILDMIELLSLGYVGDFESAFGSVSAAREAWFEHREDIGFWREMDPESQSFNPGFRHNAYVEFELRPRMRAGESVLDALRRLGLLSFAERRALPDHIRSLRLDISPGCECYQRPGESSQECLERLKADLPRKPSNA